VYIGDGVRYQLP